MYGRKVQMAREDAELVRRTLAGEERVFGELVRRYQNPVYGLALSYVGAFADAEDLAQEAFVAAYQNLARLEEPERFGPWLKSTTVNLCRNWQRSRSRAARRVERVREQVEAGVELRDGEADVRRRVLGAIERLPEKGRQAVVLYYLGGLSAAQVGRFLEISANAVEQRLHRAREQLKEEMAMVEQVLEEARPEEFPERVLAEIARRAREALARQERAQAVELYGRALELLEPLDESERRKRWQADVLWERGHAAYFLELDNRERALADVEEAVRLERELGDEKGYGKRLVGLGVDYANARRHAESLRAFEEAATLFAKLEEKDEEAWALFWIGRYLVPWLDRGKEVGGVGHDRALEMFRRAASLFAEGEDRAGEGLALAAAGLMERLGADPPEEALANFCATSMPMERTGERLRYLSQPGFKQSQKETPDQIFAYMLKPRDWLRFPLEEGASWEEQAFAYGSEEMRARSAMRGLDERVETPAGLFEGCLELETALERSGEDASERYRRLNLRNSGVRRVWFAPGVGLVKLEFRHGNGCVTEGVLTGYSASGEMDDYLPLTPGQVWDYRITNSESEYAIRDRCWVTSGDGERGVIAQYHYSEKG